MPLRNKKLISAALVIMLLLALFSAQGCSDNGGAQEPTEPPEWMRTADPSAYALGDNGFFEDAYITAYFIPTLTLDNVTMNNALYRTETDDGRQLLFAYLPDTGGSFESEVACMDEESYRTFLKTQMNEYYELNEFSFITVDGHRCMRAQFDYDPPEEPEHFVRALQYLIEDDGWILSFSFTIRSGEFPPECEQSINTIRIK